MNALRKRVLLKSPVRKIRTPGSVRGLLGNWQSYRNGGSPKFAKRSRNLFYEY